MDQIDAASACRTDAHRESAVLHAVVTANAVGEALRLQCQSMTDAGCDLRIAQ